MAFGYEDCPWIQSPADVRAQHRVEQGPPGGWAPFDTDDLHDPRRGPEYQDRAQGPGDPSDDHEELLADSDWYCRNVLGGKEPEPYPTPTPAYRKTQQHSPRPDGAVQDAAALDATAQDGAGPDVAVPDAAVPGAAVPDVAVPTDGPDGEVSADRLLDRLARLERRIGAAQAEQVGLLCALAVRHPCWIETADPDALPEAGTWTKYVADEVSARVSWTGWQAQRRIEEAQRLTQCLPETLEALATGRADYPKVRVVVSGTTDLDPASAGAVDHAVARRLWSANTAALRDRVRREVIAVDPDAARRRAGKART